jgi:acyl-CoA thioester hydrolase
VRLRRAARRGAGGIVSTCLDRAVPTATAGVTAPLFSLEMKVRDYECDLQQIVNNAVYQHYFEHTRHEFLQHLGLDFAALHGRGIDLVVVRAELDYHYPLRSGDRFVVTLDVERKGAIRFLFRQSIFLLPERRGIVTGVFNGASLRAGRPAVVAEVADALNQASTST